LTQRQLGDSDLVVPNITLGTMTFGKQNTRAEAHEQLSYALDCGINFLDSAELYPVPAEAETQGKTDEYIGSWMKSQPRDSIILASKVCGYSDRLIWFRENGEGTRVTAGQIVESVENSLRRLQTDYIDLLQIHWPDRYVSLFGGKAYDASQHRDDDVPFDTQLEAMAKLIRDGKIRHVGVSNETSFGVCQFINAFDREASLPRIASIQNSYSMLVRSSFETDLVETCAPHNCNVGLLAYSPLAGGTLTGKYLKDDVDKNSRLNLFEGYMERYKNSQSELATKAYVEVAEGHNLSPTQLALAFCNHQSFVTSTIIGATSVAQLRENIEAFDISLSDECLKDIEDVYTRFRDPSMS